MLEPISRRNLLELLAELQRLIPFNTAQPNAEISLTITSSTLMSAPPKDGKSSSFALKIGYIPFTDISDSFQDMIYWKEISHLVWKFSLMSWLLKFCLTQQKSFGCIALLTHELLIDHLNAAYSYEQLMPWSFPRTFN